MFFTNFIFTNFVPQFNVITTFILVHNGYCIEYGVLWLHSLRVSELKIYCIENVLCRFAFGFKILNVCNRLVIVISLSIKIM